MKLFQRTILCCVALLYGACLLGAPAWADPLGYAIVVRGSITNDPDGTLDYDKTTTRILMQLDDGSMPRQYVTSDNGGKTLLWYFITQWARAQMNAVPAPLYIIILDHGGWGGYFYLGSETITSLEMKGWLDTLEASLSQSALSKGRVVMIGACYSGSFIKDLSKQGRVIITSADPFESSYRGPVEPDRIRGGEFFMDELFPYLYKGFSLKKAFQMATEDTLLYTANYARPSVDDFLPFYLDNGLQHPLLDDDGDGQGTNYLTDDGGDGFVADALPVYPPLPARSEIVEVPDPLFLDAGTSDAHLWAKVNSYPETSAVLAEKMRFSVSPMQYNPSPDRWELTYAANEGKTTFSYFSLDAYTRFSPMGTTVHLISPMASSAVYRNKAGNNNPGPFALTEPAAGSAQTTVLVLRWGQAVDPDGDPVTYSVLISKDPAFAGLDYRKDNVLYPLLAIGPEANLQEGATYYWKVVAIDQYGASRESSGTGSFTTDNSGGIASLIEGYVMSAGTGLPLIGADITNSAGEATKSTANGYFAFAAAGGETAVTAAYPYHAAVTKTLAATAGRVNRLQFSLTTAEMRTLGLHVAGPGTGTIANIKTAITCYTDCVETFNTGATLKFHASSNRNSLFAKWQGAPCSGTGDCTVTLVQDTDIRAVFGTAPAVTAGMPQFISETTALLTGWINPHELTSSFRFVYSDGTNQWSTPWVEVADGGSDVPVSAAIENLVPGQTYQWWMEAQNALATVSGIASAFTQPHVVATILGKPGVYYVTIQKAYDSASEGDTIRVRDMVIPGDLLLNPPVPKTVIIEGGYDQDFLSVTGVTTVQGSLSVNAGKTSICNLVLQN